MTNKTGGAAFPSIRKTDRRSGKEWDGMRKEDLREVVNPGMSLRDYFAAKCMQGDWAVHGASINIDASNEILETNARLYYRMADAMIKIGQS
ncbi:TPA: hypothetical protein ACS7ZY_000713 [Providencia alcalifaciens]